MVTFSQTIHARFSYTADDIVWGGVFADILGRSVQNKAVINLARIHEVILPSV